MMKKFISLFLIFFFFSQQLYALDYSGFYFGIECNKPNVCAGDGKSSFKFFGDGKSSFKFFAVKQQKPIIILLKHDLNNESLSIFVSNRKVIHNAKLEGSNFRGKNKSYQIQGFLNNNTMRFEITRGELNYYYIATLSEKLSMEEKEYFAMLMPKQEKIDEKELGKEIKELTDANYFLKDEIRNFKTLNKGLKNDVQNLKNDVQNLKEKLKEAQNPWWKFW